MSDLRRITCPICHLPRAAAEDDECPAHPSDDPEHEERRAALIDKLARIEREIAEERVEEPHCPFCDKPLVLYVDASHDLQAPGALSQTWKVVCEEGEHAVLHSWEWLGIAYEAAVIAEQRGEDPDKAMAAYWHGDEYAGDDHQPHPNYDLLRIALRERGCFGPTYSHLSAHTIQPSATEQPLHDAEDQT